MSTKHPIHHIWFDFAGTLYRETPAFAAAHDAERYGLYAQVTGQPDTPLSRAQFDQLYRQHGSNAAAFHALGKPSDFWSHYLDNIDFTTLIQSGPETIRTLKALRSRQPISLFTNLRTDQIQAKLAHLQIPAEWFTHIIDGGQVSRRKPDPEGFRLLISKSSLPPEQILFVGDRESVDIIPAKNLGIQTCLIYGVSQVADFSCASFPALLTLLPRADSKS